jgi:hypothetical protein
MARSVPVVFDKPRTLRFDLEAIEHLEAVGGGQSLGSIVNNMNSMGLTALKWALWAGLRHEDEKLNPNLVRKMLTKWLNDGKDLKPLTEAVNRALLDSGVFGDRSAADVGNEPAETTETTETPA